MGLPMPGFLPGSYAYRMSKAALNMLTFCLAAEFPSITTFSVHPGHVRTAMGGDRASVDPEVCASLLWRLAMEPPASGQFIDISAVDMDSFS
jgi:NAD(P)-dependent dehydrogenase (short-subunit alcohol dehydrogenase family)